MLSTVAVAAALAVAPAVSGRKFGSFRERFGLPKPDDDKNGGFHTKTSTVTSSAKCTAVAVTKNFSASKDAHVYAIAEAWKYACSDDAKFDDWYWAHIYKNMIVKYGQKSYGFAFAKAIAATAAQCDTHGNAYGCAASYAYSAAWAEATASAHAEAWAEAVQVCDCNDKKQITAANSDAYAAESSYFKAQVEAVAESSACGYYGYDDAPDADAQTCVQNIYFTAIAKAVAIASIDGKCVHATKKIVGDAFGTGNGTGQQGDSCSDDSDCADDVSCDDQTCGNGDGSGNGDGNGDGDGSSIDKDIGTYIAAAKAKATATITVKEVYGCVGYVDGYNPYH